MPKVNETHNMYSTQQTESQNDMKGLTQAHCLLVIANMLHFYPMYNF